MSDLLNTSFLLLSEIVSIVVIVIFAYLYYKQVSSVAHLSYENSSNKKELSNSKHIIVKNNISTYHALTILFLVINILYLIFGRFFGLFSTESNHIVDGIFITMHLVSIVIASIFLYMAKKHT